MFPWFWFWAPQWHLPWSGDVAQRIDPETSWILGGSAPGPGRRIEQRALQVASYGRQLGQVADVLLDLAQQSPPRSPRAAEALAKLSRIAAEIERIKAEEYAASAAGIEAQVVALRERGGIAWETLAARLRPLLETTRLDS